MAENLTTLTLNDARIRISINPVPQNAHFSIRDNLDPDSNGTEESERHTAKHLKPKTSTELGKVKNFRSVLENTSFSIFLNFDPISIPID
jgi:hypothetical protein